MMQSINVFGVIALSTISMLCFSILTARSAGISAKRPVASAKKLSANNAKRRPADNATMQRQAFATYLKRDFVQANKLFKDCYASQPGDVSVNYYLGASALYAGDYKTAEHALCRVVVMSPAGSEFSTLATKSLQQWRSQFQGLEPYTCLTEGKLFRWQKSKGPIKVWVSDGLQLPNGFVGPEMSSDKCKTLYGYFQQPAFFRRLETAVHYVPQYREIVKSGINDWGWCAKEGLISFEFTEDPTKADVLYFWCPQSGGGSVGYTFNPWTNTPNARCIVHIETEYLRKWGSRAPAELRKTSAHEFGHVLGLHQHSPNPNDLMCGQGKMVTYREMTSYSTNSAVTKNDYATLRALYELPPGESYVQQGR